MTPAQRKAALRALEALSDIDLAFLTIDGDTPPEVEELALEEIARREEANGCPLGWTREAWEQHEARAEQAQREIEEASKREALRKQGCPPLAPKTPR